MSQHIFYTMHENEQTKIMMGWDRPLQGFFMVIEKDSDIDRPFWSNLFQKPSHQKTLDGYLSLLDKFKIQIPQKMIDEILADGKNNEGNKEIKHSIDGGAYKREVCDEL